MKKILVLTMLTCCGFINSIFAGDNIEEIESALKNNLLRRNLQNLKSSPNEVSYEAYGNDLGKTFGSGSIDLYFDLPSGVKGDMILKIDAYDVDYPSATEKDLVYFNDEEIGRLEGRNNTYVVDTFKVPASYINSGQNKLRIDVNVSNEGWVTAVREAVLIGSAFTLKASDGTHPYGVKLEWTNIGADKYEIWRSEHSLFDYSPKKIAEVSSGNTYIDENAEVGAVYDYYIKVGEQTSTEDTGFSGKKSVIPIITNVETSKIWVQHSGGMKQVRITWNDFSRKLYSVRDLVFVLENSTKPFYIHHMPNISYDSSKGTYYTELSLDSCILDTHGKLKVNLFWEYREASKGFNTSCPVSQNFDVNVFYDKYGIQDNIPNWFRYWHDDQAIKDADQYLAVELIGTKNQLDGRFRYDPFAGKSLGAAQTFNSSFEALFDINGFPKTYIIKKNDVVFSLGPLGAAKKKSFEISNNGVTKIVGSPSLGLETTAQVIKHELKHFDTFKELCPLGYLKIGTDKINYTTQFKTFNDYTNQLALANCNNISDYFDKKKIFEYINNQKFTLDFDGDGVNDELETNGYREWNFSTTKPDTWSFHTKDNNFGSYATYGDNEVLARDAEKEGSEIINRENDWAFPGSKIAKEYEGYKETEWVSVSNQVIQSLALFPSQTSNFTLKNHRNLKGEDSSSDVGRIFCYSTETDNLPEFVDIEDTGSVSIIGPATSVVLSNESSLFTNLVFNLTVTNSSDITECRNITGWLVDSNGEPVAITKTGFTISQYKSITLNSAFGS